MLLGPNKKEIEDLVEKLAEAFKIEDQGDLSDYLGIKIERKKYINSYNSDQKIVSLFFYLVKSFFFY